MNPDVKRYLLPPLVAVPLIVGFTLIVLGATADPDRIDQTLVGLGTIILVGNAVFWPLIFHKRGRDRREAAKRRALEAAGRAGGAEGTQGAQGYGEEE